jgi:hypothetical protein
LFLFLFCFVVSLHFVRIWDCRLFCLCGEMGSIVLNLVHESVGVLDPLRSCGHQFWTSLYLVTRCAEHVKLTDIALQWQPCYRTAAPYSGIQDAHVSNPGAGWPGVVYCGFLSSRHTTVSCLIHSPNPRFLSSWFSLCLLSNGCIIRSFITCTLHQILLVWPNQGGWDGRGM